MHDQHRKGVIAINTTVLIVDDEQRVLDVIQPYLEKEGFHVLTTNTGNQALQLIDTHSPNLIILDWMLPEMSGLEICREIRKKSDLPVIMLTAKSDEPDRVIGLEMGADDYITKPFSLRELAARIRTVLRRINPTSFTSHTMQRGEITIDEEKLRVLKNGEEIALTPAEFQILFTLAKRPGVVYSRLQLLQATSGEAYFGYERSIDSHISHLRKKLEPEPAKPKYIFTVHGIGYRFGDFK